MRTPENSVIYEEDRKYCRLIELSLERQRRDLIELPKTGKYRFNQKEVDSYVDFHETFLRHYEGRLAKTPFILHPYQIRHFIEPLFGWQKFDEESQTWVRRYRKAYIQQTKKSGKSAIVSGMGAYMLVGSGEYGAQCFSAATGIKQARQVHDAAKKLLKASLESGLKGYIDIVANTISFSKMLASWKVLTGDADSNDGILPYFASADEYHRWKNRDLMDVIEKGMVTGEQPLLVIITTAGSNFLSPCYQERLYAERVLDGTYQDESYFAYIAEPDKGDDWKDPETHRKVNPSLGITIKESAFELEFQKALRSKDAELKFKRFHLNYWVEIEEHWLDMDLWRTPRASFIPDALKGQQCYLGVDLSSIKDLTAVVAVFPLIDRCFAVLPFFFCPIENIDKRSFSDGVPYRRWLEEGKLIATAGTAIDYKAIRKKINDLGAVYDIQEIAVDRWNATQLITELSEEDGFKVEAMGQGYRSMSDPSKFLDAAVIEGRCLHNNHEILTWNAGNAVIRKDPAGNIKPDKEKSTECIDGITALLNAIGRMTLHIKKEPSKYEKMGVVIL